MANRWNLFWVVAATALCASTAMAEQSTFRIASYNGALNRDSAGALIADLEGIGDEQAQDIAGIIQWIAPDILLVNEIDRDSDARAAEIFRTAYLGAPQQGQKALDYPHVYAPPVNTGVDSGFDLDKDGAMGGPGDAWGFGAFPGQYGFAIYSRFPLLTDDMRSFQTLRWQDMPGSLLHARDREGMPLSGPDGYYGDDEARELRLSSKTHLDLPVQIGDEIVHILASHPTPPVFDGPEDRNGKRNHDEIRFWADYIEGRGWMSDDTGRNGGLDPGKRFVILGDLNADPFDGDSTGNAAQLLLNHPAILASPTDPEVTPMSEGARSGSQGSAHKGDPRFDTAAFGKRVGNLRVDYVLPSKAGFRWKAGGVAWPFADDEMAEAVKASDHRLVWVDLELAPVD